jgi:hypothetical protein
MDTLEASNVMNAKSECGWNERFYGNKIIKKSTEL